MHVIHAIAALEKSARLGAEASLLLRSELGLVNLRRQQLDGIKDQLAKDKVMKQTHTTAAIARC